MQAAGIDECEELRRAHAVGSLTVLLTRDIPADGEDALARRAPALLAQLLMVPHPGTRSSSRPALPAAVAPSRIVAQSGYCNRHGHRPPEVVERCATRGIELARIDHGGALRWRLAAGGGFERTAARAMAVRYRHSRPSTGQGRPPAEDLDEGQTDEAPREPLSGMPERAGLVYILLDWFGSSSEGAGTTTRTMQAAG